MQHHDMLLFSVLFLLNSISLSLSLLSITFSYICKCMCVCVCVCICACLSEDMGGWIVGFNCVCVCVCVRACSFSDLKQACVLRCFCLNVVFVSDSCNALTFILSLSSVDVYQRPRSIHGKYEEQIDSEMSESRIFVEGGSTLQWLNYEVSCEAI